jgi:uncharacterized protein
VVKADNVITLYYSFNGNNWFLISHLLFNNTKKLVVGFLAQSPTGNNCEVKFSNSSYREIYTGE